MRFPHNDGMCRWCEFKGKMAQRLGRKHPMLPNKVFHGKAAWKMTHEVAILNPNWKIRIEEDVSDID